MTPAKITTPARTELARTELAKTEDVDTTCVSGPQALRDSFYFAGGTPKAGVEIEFHMQDTRIPDPSAPAADARVQELKAKLDQRLGQKHAEEIAGQMVEVSTAPYALSQIAVLLDNIARKQAAVVEEAAKLDLKPVPFAAVPGLDAARAEANMIAPTADNPRRGVLFGHFLDALRRQRAEKIIPYPFLNVSVQASVTAKDPDHLFAMMRRHYSLLPFFFVLFNNRAPAFEGTGAKMLRHEGIAARRALGERGLVPADYTRSRSGDEYIDRYFKTVYQRNMFCHADAQGQFTAAANPVSLEKLQRQGLATLRNAHVAMQMDWHSCKLRAIGATRALRAEMRDMDTGGHHATSMAAINALMNLDDECGAAMDALLARYGYGAVPADNAAMLKRDIDTVARNVPLYMNVPYGRGKMKDFARDFIAVIDEYAARRGVDGHITALRHACVNAMPEARALGYTLRTPQAVAHFQRSYDTALFTNPRVSAAMHLR